MLQKHKVKKLQAQTCLRKPTTTGFPKIKMAASGYAQEAQGLAGADNLERQTSDRQTYIGYAFIIVCIYILCLSVCLSSFFVAPSYQHKL